MVSILYLPDDCLHRIVSYIEDPSSFHSIALTCKRFLHVTRNMKSVLHTNLLRVKAEYFIKCYMVEIGNHEDLDENYEGLHDLLVDSARLTEAKERLTYDKLISVWQRNGPVVAKLFTWMRDLEFIGEVGHRPLTSFAEHRSVTLHLPNCRKNVTIKTSYYDDNGHHYTGGPELSIHITCGDLDVKSEDFARNSPEDYMDWKDKEVIRAVEPMKVVIELLQKELGETVPPITNHFFIWLCYFFPDGSNLDEENKLRFKDTARNMKPDHIAVQSAIDEFRKHQQIESKFQKLATGWESDEDQTSKFSTVIVETVRALIQRLQTGLVLYRLTGYASRFHKIVTHRNMKELPKQLLLDLILRTTPEGNNYNAFSIANKHVENTIYFKCFGGKVMKVCGSIHNNGARYLRWEKLRLEFSLPDGKVLNVEAHHSPIQVENLGPVTELLLQCVNHSMHGEQDVIPRIGNLFTAAFLLIALDLDMDLDTFLGRNYSRHLSITE